MAKRKTDLERLQAKLMKNPKFKAEFEQASPFLEIAREITRIRLEAGLTQKELAERVGTTQSAIARLESLDYDKVKVHTLNRLAEALGLELEIRFKKPVKRPARKVDLGLGKKTASR